VRKSHSAIQMILMKTSIQFEVSGSSVLMTTEEARELRRSTWEFGHNSSPRDNGLCHSEYALKQHTRHSPKNCRSRSSSSMLGPQWKLSLASKILTLCQILLVTSLLSNASLFKKPYFSLFNGDWTSSSSSMELVTNSGFVLDFSLWIFHFNW
jgi:hypothetical protein